MKNTTVSYTQIWDRVWDPVLDQIILQVSARAHGQVLEQIRAGVRNPFERHIWNEVEAR